VWGFSIIAGIYIYANNYFLKFSVTKNTAYKNRKFGAPSAEQTYLSAFGGEL
jgi:hypothetical protein